MESEESGLVLEYARLECDGQWNTDINMEEPGIFPDWSRTVRVEFKYKNGRISR